MSHVTCSYPSEETVLMKEVSISQDDSIHTYMYISDEAILIEETVLVI